MGSVYTPSPERTMITALAHEAAKRKMAVFPARGKEPVISKREGGNGYKDASSDHGRVTAMFNKAGRKATGYGIATGAASGVVVVDVDGPEARAEAERLGLRSEFVVKTGRPEGDGWHLYFKIPPGVKIRSRVLALGVELKAEGCYVVGPGSLHPSGATYRLVKDGKPSPMPECLLESEPDASLGDRVTDSGPVTVDLAGPQIAEGARNRELTRIAGRLHDGTRDQDQLAACLLAINSARCAPPLDEAEVSKIAASIYGREQCKPAPEPPPPEALQIVEGIEADLETLGWSPQREHTDYDFMVALCRIARRHSTVIPAGVRVEASIREIIEEAAIGSTRTGWKSANRLRSSGWLRRDGTGSGPKRGAFVLLSRAKGNIHPPGGVLEPPGVSSVSPGAPQVPPRSASRLRWSAPGQAGRLGKRRGRIIDVLEYTGGLNIDELADALTGEDGKRPRPRDLKRRTLPAMLASRVVECEAGKYRLSAEWRAALDRRREEDGEIAAAEYQRREHERQRERFAEAWKRGEVVSKDELARRRHRRRHPYHVHADHAPTHDEMQERWESRPERRREAIKEAIARLFEERPEYRTRRTGQVTCALVNYLGKDFPRGPDGVPKDAEVEELLEGQAA